MGEPILDPGRQAGICVHDGTEWRKVRGDTDGHPQIDVVSAPTTTVIPAAGERIFGFSEIITGKSENPNLSAGTNILSSPSVTTGKVWVIRALCLIYVGTAPDVLDIQIFDGTVDYTIIRKPGIAHPDSISWQGKVFLKAGWQIRGVVHGATAGDAMSFTWHGYELTAP